MPEEKGHYTRKEIAKGAAVFGLVEGLTLLAEGPIGVLSGFPVSAIAGYTIAGRSRLKRERKEFEAEKRKLEKVL